MSIADLVETFGDVIRQAMRYVTSADKAYQWLRSQEIPITRDVVRNVWKAVGEKELYRTVIETWGTTRAIPEAWVVDWETKEAKGLLQFVEATWYQPDTGEVRKEIHTWFIDKLTPFADIVDDIIDAETDYAEISGYKLISLSNAGVKRLIPKGE